MAENISHSKINKRKALVSDSEGDEMLKKHKAADSDDPTEREGASSGKISEKYATGSQQPKEVKKNGKYEKHVENGLTDSDSAGTDVEPTTDDESPQPNRRPKKKRKMSLKSERRSRNNLQVGSSSESDDEGPLSPKSPPSSKKSFRRRRTISGGKAPSKKSSDSESYKTDSESEEDSQNLEPSKDSNTSPRIKDKEGGSKSQAVKEMSDAKDEVEEGSSDSEDDLPLQKPKHCSSSEESDRAAKGKEKQVPTKKNKSEVTADSKQVIDRDTESSSDQCSDPTGPQKREKKEITMKQDSSSEGGKVKTRPETTDDSEDETSRNPDAVKRERSTSGDSDSEPLVKGKSDRKLETKKKIKKEENSSDSDSDSSRDKKEAKGTEGGGRSESPLNSAKREKLQSDSDSSSSKEDTKKEKRQKNKLPDEDKRIISLKKYLKTAGIRVHNYSELWKDCRSNKARAQKLLSLLEDSGLKGRPTIEKCKKLRKKIETRREVEELDLANVMECGEGRTRRSRQRTSASQELPNETLQASSDVRKRLRVLADSDSSESD